MPANDINAWMAQLLEQLRLSWQRQLVILQADEAWCALQLQTLSRCQPDLRVFSNRAITRDAIPFDKVETSLGGEARMVVLDLFTGFNPDVLCVAAGLVQAGGVLVIMAPALSAGQLEQDQYALWQNHKRSLQPFFAHYFFNAVAADEQIGILLGPDSWPAPHSPQPALQLTQIERGLTSEQAQILQQIEHWLQQSKPGIALIHADRGRGKSSCLGFLAQRQASLRLLVTASSRASAAALLALAPGAGFVAPDQLLQQAPPAELVLIDEAAMIPISMLRQIYRIYPRLVIATTDGGYEGTGKGFMLRFIAELDAFDLQRYEILQPVRWAAGDQLETWLNRVLMLTAATPAEAVAAPTDYQIQRLNEPDSAEFLALMPQIYRLLSAAHYRTRPSDLRMLMENPDQTVIVARAGAAVLGVVVLNQEGGFDAQLSNEIFFGRRRPRGHLLAQMLTAQAGVKQFAQYHGVRIQRIAVARDSRRQGIGRALIEHALGYAREQGQDYIGASFALDPAVVEFWRRLEFTLVHVGYASGKSTGNNSIAVLRTLSVEATDLLPVFKMRIARQLPTWMTLFLQNLSAPEVVCLLGYAEYRAQLTELEQQEIDAFATGNKGFELCFASLQKFVMQRVAAADTIPPRLLIEKVVQNRAWKLLETPADAGGRKQLQRRIRDYVDALL